MDKSEFMLVLVSGLAVIVLSLAGASCQVHHNNQKTKCVEITKKPLECRQL